MVTASWQMVIIQKAFRAVVIAALLPPVVPRIFGSEPISALRMGNYVGWKTGLDGKNSAFRVKAQCSNLALRVAQFYPILSTKRLLGAMNG